MWKWMKQFLFILEKEDFLKLVFDMFVKNALINGLLLK